MTSSSAQSSPPAAVILDVDGTLLDTVYLHVIAWWESFREQGHQVSCFDIHRAIGMGSEELVEKLLGESDEKVVEGHSGKWAPLRDRCTTFHDVPELIQKISELGLKVVYATSGSEEDTKDFRERIGCDDHVDAVVSSADVESSKPAPDIVELALKEVGVSAERAVMVGDTVYDVRAAAAAGVPCIGLVCGGISEQELKEAGAAVVYGNPSELLQDLEGSPIGALLKA